MEKVLTMYDVIEIIIKRTNDKINIKDLLAVDGLEITSYHESDNVYERVIDGKTYSRRESKDNTAISRQ